MSYTEISMGFVKFCMLKKKKRNDTYSNSLGVKLALFIGIIRYNFLQICTKDIMCLQTIIISFTVRGSSRSTFSEKGMQHLKMNWSSC